jgi:membrane protein DedA with SNARE-associated domain
VVSIEHALAMIEPWISAYGVGALFATIYLESFGVPLPSESAIVAATTLALRGDFPLSSVFGAALLAAALGDTTGYFIGRIGGRPLLMRFGPKIGLSKSRYEEFACRMRQHGFTLVMLARFVWGLRQLNGVIAGASGLPLSRFLPANIIGACLWVSVWAVAPFLFADWFALGQPRAKK